MSYKRISGNLKPAKRSQENVSAILSVSSLEGKAAERPKRNNEFKAGFTQESRKAASPSKRGPERKSSKKPAWLLKQSIDDKTPRMKTSNVRPSIKDFLNEEPKESTHKNNKTSESLLEILAQDTERSDYSVTYQNDEVLEEKGPVKSDLEEFILIEEQCDEQYNIRKPKTSSKDHKLNGITKGPDIVELDEILRDSNKEKAAQHIQKWWRRLNIRRAAGKAAMQRMIEDKRTKMQNKLNDERQQEYEKQLQEYEQMKQKEDRARAARQKIIADIHKNTTNSKHKKSRIKTTATNVERGKKSSVKRSSVVCDSIDSTPSRPDTSSTITKKVDAIFESSCYDTNSSITQHGNKEQFKQNDNETVVIDQESVGGRSRTTFEDLMNTLKELEDEEPCVAKSSAFQRPQQNKLGKKEQLNSLLSADKLQSIMSFLDEVEKVEDDIQSEVMRGSMTSYTFSQNEKQDNVSVAENSISAFDSVSQVATDINNAIEQQKIEISEKEKTLGMMKKAINQQKEFTTVQMREMDKEHKKQLSIQREEYENTIQRHLSFIDQLIDDKKVLTKRCEDLVVKLKDVDQKYAAKIRQMTDSHAVELKKQKEISEAAEKLRREKWIKEKTQEIKEITVKGLEPDIQKLIAKHKAEIKKIKAMKQGEVLEADERVGRKYVQQLEDLRTQLEKEKEIALRKERDLARQRYECQIREEEESFQQQRRRLYKEIEEEKQRLSEQSQQMKKDFDERKSVYEASLKQNFKVMEDDHSKQMTDLHNNHQNEMKQLKEQLDIEKQQWIEKYMKKQETHLLAKERELKENVRDARDREIEMVIERLEQENSISREESERAAENRIKRLRDKYENEIKEVERSERTTQEKCSTLKERLDDMENECLRLKSDVKLKDQHLIDVQKVSDRLQEERGKVSDVIRQEFADRLVVLEEESKRLRTELSEEKARHKFDIDRLSQDKDDEMEEVHKRVKKAVAKKEETIQLLRQQMLTAEKRADHLEQLLADQRKKILGK